MELQATELSQAIRAVREGLAEAQQDGAGSGLRFRVKEITLDLEIELRHSSSTGGGVRAYVVNAMAKGERLNGHTQRLTVTLGAQDLQGGDLLVGDQRSGFAPLPEIP